MFSYMKGVTQDPAVNIRAQEGCELGVEKVSQGGSS